MTIQAMTLYEALSSIPDHRTKKGRRFPLAAILAIALAAMLAGADSLMAIFRWGRRLSPKALHALGVDEKRRKAPCHATYHYVFKELSVDDLSRVLGGWAAAPEAEAEMEETEEAEGDEGEAVRHVAIDGKRLRGSHHGGQPGVHVLYAFASQLRATLGSLQVPPDSGEVIEVLELLKRLPLKGTVVTGDAAFSFETVVEAIRAAGGHYFLFVKGNQPELQAEIAHAFGDDSPLQDQLAAGHGRQTH